ncbi:MAG: hypothetical protein WKF95_13840 [Rubrobacter sp.]
MNEDRERVRDVTVEIPERVWEAATAFVPEGATPEERLPTLVAAAFEEWVRWMEGSFRPTSISELETSRAYELYDRLFLEDMPSADHLGGLLLLPMGRARYLMQALAYRHGRMLRERRTEHIRNALEAAERDEQGRPYVVIDPGCRDIFDRTTRALRAQSRIQSGLEGDVVLEGVRYEMGENHLEALKVAFAPQEDGAGGE